MYGRKRPDNIYDIYQSVCREIHREIQKNRPVLVIWDSILHLNEFIQNHSFYEYNIINGVDINEDAKSIEKAGEIRVLTIATFAAGRGVDIKLSDEAKAAGGLHVIIPMKMPNQRSLEQAAGRAGRKGEPGSVSIYIADHDMFKRSRKFKESHNQIEKLQLKFATYLKENFKWMINGCLFNDLDPETIYPFAAKTSVVLDILARRLLLEMNNSKNLHFAKHIFKNYSLYIVILSWAVFYTELSRSIDDSCKENEMAKFVADSYETFLNDLTVWFNPQNKTIDEAMEYFGFILSEEADQTCITSHSIQMSFDYIDYVFDSNKTSNDYFDELFDKCNNETNEVHRRLQNGEKINWLEHLLSHDRDGMVKTLLSVYSLNIFTIQSNFDKITTGLKRRLQSNYDYYKNKDIFHGTPKWLYETIIGRNHDVTIDMIKRFAQILIDQYDGVFNFGNFVRTREESSIFSPSYVCLEENKTLYVLIKGSSSDFDWISDAFGNEESLNIFDTTIYFHYGFLSAARGIMYEIKDILCNYDTIYFAGHSYGAAVASILCLFAKANFRLSFRKIYAFCYVPPPAMPFCPTCVKKCIYAFINRCDIVPSACFNNLINTARSFGCSYISIMTQISVLFNQS